MENINMKKIRRLFSIKLLKILSLILFTLCFILYGFFDITTSKQTYHIGYDRTASKVFLVALVVICFVCIALCFIDKKYRCKKFLKYLFKDYSFIYYASIFGILLCAFISIFVNKTSIELFFTQGIYYISFIIITLFFKFLLFGDDISQSVFNRAILLLFFFYYFILLFYFFYLLGKPMSSGNFRIPVLSHIFFPMSLIPSLKILLGKRVFIIYLILFPLLFLSDKTSVFIIFIVYVLSDFFNSNIYHKNKKLCNILMLILTIIILVFIVVSNIWVDSFLFKKFSFQTIIVNSGRLQNWTAVFDGMKSFSFIDYIFGKGTSATTLVNNGTAAHNDFIEFLYDYGVIGLIFALSFAYYFIYSSIKHAQNRNRILIAFYVLLFMLISAIFSNANMLLCIGFAFIPYYEEAKKVELEQTEVFYEVYI